jgi:hypothetical protein
MWVALPLLGTVLAGSGCVPMAPPEDDGPYFNNTTDPTNAGATYVGADACIACHSTVGETHSLHGHAHALTRVQGQPPSFPTAATRASVPNPPDGFTWGDISYVIGGYARAAHFIDNDGFVLTTGVDQVNTQWNLSVPPNGTASGFVPFRPDADSPLEYSFSVFERQTTGALPQDPDSPEFQDNRPGITGTWSDEGVQCEACHGPGSNHLPNPAARDIFVGSQASACGKCHAQNDDPGIILAEAGFIRPYQQWAELLASGGHSSFACTTCHSPHASTAYDRQNAIRNECAVCHSGQDLAFHEGAIFVRGDYTEELTCVSCHMSFATMEASFAGVEIVGPEGRMGDTRTHIFRINSQSADGSVLFTADGTQVIEDEAGEAALTLDFVCSRCHNGIGNAPLFPATVLPGIAANMHD